MIFDNLSTEIAKIISFTEAEFEHFQSYLEVMYLKKGEDWERADKVASFAGFVNKGILRAYKSDAENEFIHEFHIENEFIGNYIGFQNQIRIEIVFVLLKIVRFSFGSIVKMSQEMTVVKTFSEIIAKRKESNILIGQLLYCRKAPKCVIKSNWTNDQNWYHAYRNII